MISPLVQMDYWLASSYPGATKLLGYQHCVNAQNLERKLLPKGPFPKSEICSEWLSHPDLLGTSCLQIYLFCQFLCLSLFSLSSCLRMVEDVMSVCSLL